MMGYNETNFSADTIANWWEPSEELTEDAGLLHSQMAPVGRLCIELSGACNGIVEFLNEVLAKRNSVTEIENAVAISCIEWPKLKALSDQHDVPSNVIDGLRTQWERFGRLVASHAANPKAALNTSQ